jgi:hypothetical protein
MIRPWMATQGGWEEVGAVERLAECNGGCLGRDGGSDGRSVEVAGFRRAVAPCARLISLAWQTFWVG